MPRLRNRPGNGVSLGRYRTAADADPEHLEPSQPRRSKPRRTPWAGTGRCRPTDTSASPTAPGLGVAKLQKKAPYALKSLDTELKSAPADAAPSVLLRYAPRHDEARAIGANRATTFS